MPSCNRPPLSQSLGNPFSAMATPPALSALLLVLVRMHTSLRTFLDDSAAQSPPMSLHQLVAASTRFLSEVLKSPLCLPPMNIANMHTLFLLATHAHSASCLFHCIDLACGTTSCWSTLCLNPHACDASVSVLLLPSNGMMKSVCLAWRCLLASSA